ncbi:RNA-directed RNA polymerase [Ascochyta rabiei]|uniref:RNA-directed RNA polymerase n=1 Tax=Didymella rabiei TaxID=5454 RepID=UPI0022059C99|nr:RNA-directed RNA polymerase [Ascochyta rabiei]UPX13823.1 RNA-directed RNA polymerase [Ascochyta rabiei]
MSVAPVKPGSKQSSFTLNGHQIRETYKPRLSAASSSTKPSPTVTTVLKSNIARQQSSSQYVLNRSLISTAPSSWALNQELKVKILGIHKKYWTKDVYFAMSELGTVTKIDIQSCSRDNNVWVIFQPPPKNLPPQRLRINQDFVRYEIQTPWTSTVPSPVDSARDYQECNILFADSIDFGVRIAESGLAKMHEVRSKGNIQVTLDLKRKELDIQFPMAIDLENYNFRFRLPITQLSHIYRIQDGDNSSSLIIPFDVPPQFFAQKKLSTHDSDFFPTKERSWKVWSTWFRETDVVDGRTRRQLQTMPLIQHKGSATIDIGQWTAYRLLFNNETMSGPQFDEFRSALGDFGVTIQDSDQFTTSPGHPFRLSEILGEEFADTYSHTESSHKASIFDDLVSDQVHLAFPVRYQLEACMSNGFIKENSVTREFLRKLEIMDPLRAVHILEKVVDKQHVYYDPMDIFMIRIKSIRQRSIPRHCVMQRSVNITPTMMHVASPIMEISNRITRQYLADAERFIRVKFSDEKGEGPLRNMPGGRADALFNRVSRAMKHGIVVAGRYYEFLAFGNSQFRENGAYFYAPTSTKSAHDIRMTLGQFDHIKTIAKYGARLGQCFSTTRAMQTTVNVQKIPDIERNGYSFTDGVGKLSEFLAQMAAQDLGLHNAFDDPPSLYQFRLGGCKGVLALDPALKKKEVHIRPSQHKFDAVYTGLEIIRCSSLATPFFNRQIISILSHLGVSDRVFIRKQQHMVNAYELAMTNKTEAMDCLLKHIDMNQTTLTMASMVLDGFLESREPFMMSLLHLWRASTIKDLKKKARIAIDDGAFVLGCVDESGILRGHYDEPQSRLDATREEKLDTLPEIFIQIDNSSRKGHYKVIEGTCILARNPSLHPGDVRVVRAVDKPALHHHKNVVVLPQDGDRDLANMCSGGDLDGDDYMVLWDNDLLPKTINVPPMDFTPVKPIEKVGPIDIADVSDFFVTYMKNDSLGRIAHAHLAQADHQDAGVNSRVCLELANLHSQAVDYSKSGIPAVMDYALGPKKWPHFMEKKHKPASQIYDSKKILGLLYDQVQLVDFKPTWEDNFDQRILDVFDLDKPLLQKAAETKADYDDALKRLMAKHGIKTEFEAFSVFVLVHNEESRDYKFAEEFGRTVGALKAQYRETCIAAAEATSIVEWDRIGPFVAAMYSVTAKEMREALDECRKTKTVGGQEVPLRRMDAESMPLMSFPWIFYSELGKLATGARTTTQLEITRGKRPQTQHHSNGKETGFELGTVETDEGVTRFGEVLNLDFEDTQATVSPEHFSRPGDHGKQEEGAQPRGSPPVTSSSFRSAAAILSDDSKVYDRQWPEEDA